VRVRAEVPSYKQLQLDLPRSASVAELKRRICEQMGIQPELVRLRANGSALEDRENVARLEGRVVEVDYLWARQLPLWGSHGQARLAAATVIVAGAGALGNEVAKNLAMVGVGRIVLVDRDEVELSNTSRMVFFGPEDVGRKKAQVLRDRLERKFPHLRLEARAGEVERMGAVEWIGADAIASCLDNIVSRIALAAAARRYGLPLVDGGIAGYQGRVQAYLPPDDPCPICAIPAESYAQIAGLRNPCDPPAGEAKVPSLSTTVSAIAAIQAHEVVKLILSRGGQRGRDAVVGEPLRGILIIDLRYGRFSTVEAKRNPSCHVCGKEGIAKEPVRRVKVELEKGLNLERRVRRLLGATGELAVFRGECREKVNLSSTRLAKGDLLEAIYEVQGRQFREALIELH